MSVARRRVLLYWLLLIFPALLVGLGAAWMLRRESLRIADQARQAAAARQDAVRERATAIGESVESLMADVQNSLAISLRETPLRNEQSYLVELMRSNALVADVFGVTADGTILWGGSNRATRAWMADRPWSEEPRARVVAEPETQLQYAVPQGDFEVVANQSFVESANFRSALQRDASRKSLRGEEEKLAETREQARADDSSNVFASRLVTWTTAGEGGDVAVYAWMPAEEGGYVGLALEVSGLIERIRQTLPQDKSSDERYFLSAESTLLPYGKTRGDALVALVNYPLSSALLPGWQVEGFWLEGAGAGSAGRIGFGLGMILVVLLVVAIIAGGSLLLREAERSAKEAAQRVSFVSHISHEFKTPLTTIRMYAELLAQDRVKEEAKRSEYFDVIGQETSRLTRLVNNALEFGRLEHGGRTINPVEIDIARELRTIAATQQARCASREITLKEENLVAVCVARCDRDVLHHIVLNLIDNVCKYAATGGEVLLAVRTSFTGGRQVVVGDRGPGIDRADQERIFARFARLDDALTSEQKGAGLGLSISRDLARRMGGDLTYSPRDGGGAEFIISLP